MSKKSFIQGAAILAVAGLMVKVLGAIFRIPLGNMIGDVGMAYYQPAYYIYNLFLVLATSGIPVATVAIDGAENRTYTNVKLEYIK